MHEITISDLAQLQSFADSLARVLPPNVTIGLVGTLGAGKTTLTQSIARSLGVDSSDVTSPTFTLLQSHQAMHPSGTAMRLHHLDAYRIADEDEFYELGVDELIDEDDAWTIIEWADRVQPCLPDETLWIKLKLDGDTDARTVTLWSDDQTLAAAVASVGKWWVSRS